MDTVLPGEDWIAATCQFGEVSPLFRILRLGLISLQLNHFLSNKGIFFLFGSYSLCVQ